jgi:ABC-type dipeptide/oligopeptide/nickel transport system permease subunit
MANATSIQAPLPAAEVSTVHAERGAPSFKKALRRLQKMPLGVASGVVLLTIVMVAVLAPVVAPHDPYDSELINRLKPPVWEAGGTWNFILGTDQVGRDTLSRLIYGAQVSLMAGFFAMLISLSIGVPLGMIAGYWGKTTDTIISTVINVQLTFPFVLLALTVVSVLGPSFANVILVLGIASWTVYARVIRSEVRKIRELDFVLASRALGISNLRIIALHIFPNTINTVIVLSTVQIARFIIAEAFLSFLGLGVQAPTPSWGSMLGDSRQFMYDRWWLPTLPGLAIFLTSLAINLFGDTIRDWLDPYSRNVA